MVERCAGERRPLRIILPELGGVRCGPEVPLSKEERAHVRSRRLRDGDELVLLDGKGGRGLGRLTSKGTAVAVLSFEKNSGGALPGEPQLKMTVLLAAAEPARVEWAIEKGTECGAAAFVLLACERSQGAHVAAVKARLPRLRRIAQEATKQCGRTVVPTISGPKSTRDFLRGVEKGRRSTLLVADPAGRPLEYARWSRSPRRTSALSERSEFALEGEEASAAERTPVFLAIGPEGGFSPAELALFAEKGGQMVSLGPRILRLETAVVVALSLLVDPG